MKKLINFITRIFSKGEVVKERKKSKPKVVKKEKVSRPLVKVKKVEVKSPVKKTSAKKK
jgi:hypothetical protein